MAFKNQDALRQMMKKKQDVPEEVKPEPMEESASDKKPVKKPIIKKLEDKIMITDKNTGMTFLQNPVLKVTKNVGFNIRITEETKENIKRLADKYSMSQSDLITALVADAIRRDADSK